MEGGERGRKGRPGFLRVLYECRIMSVFKLDDKSHTVSWACTVYIAKTDIVL